MQAGPAKQTPSPPARLLPDATPILGVCLREVLKPISWCAQGYDDDHRDYSRQSPAFAIWEQPSHRQLPGSSPIDFYSLQLSAVLSAAEHKAVDTYSSLRSSDEGQKFQAVG